jgi:hypothetical protein
VQQPEKIINDIFNFLRVTTPTRFIKQLPVLNSTNFGKWENSFSQDEIAQIGPILNPVLLKLGDTDDNSWYLGDRK